MLGIDPEVACHKIPTNPIVKPVQQRQRQFAPERNKVINNEVEHLLEAKFTQEVHYPEWTANIVVVHKKNEK